MPSLRRETGRKQIDQEAPDFLDLEPLLVLFVSPIPLVAVLPGHVKIIGFILLG